MKHGIVNLTTAGMMGYHRSYDNNRILAHVQALPLPCGDYQSRRVALFSILPQLSRRKRTAPIPAQHYREAMQERFVVWNTITGVVMAT